MNDMPSMYWPAHDFSRVPFAAYHDPAVYELEQERIFRGKTWNYLGLEAEIPKPGDFKTTHVGDTPILVNRAADGALHAFVNRCMHRGAILRRETCGNARTHVCAYHHWCYSQAGALLGVPFSRGVRGKGGLPDDFDKSKIRLTTLRLATYKGVIFGSFASDVEPLVDYLGPKIGAQMDRFFARPIKILGYQRQRIFGNWKYYSDNVRDANHGPLLHQWALFIEAAAGSRRPTMEVGSQMDDRHRHCMTYNRAIKGPVKPEQGGEPAPAASEDGDTIKIDLKGQRLRDTRMLQYRPESTDGIVFMIMSVFPLCVFQQMMNALCTRHLRPRGAEEMEICSTYFGYEDDDQAMIAHRMRQSCLSGPGGYISMEDAEAVEICHRGTKREQDQHAILEIGGKGEICDQFTTVTEVPVRGFWSHYCELMGFVPLASSGTPS